MTNVWNISFEYQALFSVNGQDILIVICWSEK